MQKGKPGLTAGLRIAGLALALGGVPAGCTAVDSGLEGIPGADRTTFPASLARRKGLTFMLARRANEVFPRAIDLVRQGRVDLASLVSACYPLDQVGEAFTSAVARGGLKVLVEPTPPLFRSAA